MPVCVHTLEMHNGINVCTKCGMSGMEILRKLTYELKEEDRYGEDFKLQEVAPKGRK